MEGQSEMWEISSQWAGNHCLGVSHHCEQESWIWLGLQDVHLITAWDALRFDTPLKWGVTVRMLNKPNSLDRCHENISMPSQSHTVI